MIQLRKTVLILFLGLEIEFCLADVSAFYTLPEGAFVSGINETGTIIDCDIYIPYSTKEHRWVSTEPQGEGTWKIGSQEVGHGETYIHPCTPMNSFYLVPQLEETGKTPYQYGSMTTTNDANSVRIGDSTSHFMTPAKLVCDRVAIAEAIKNGHGILAQAADYNTSTNNVMGLYFNNTDVMYIDAVRIPITTADKDHPEREPFPRTDSHIKVRLYPAIAIAGKEGNRADRSHVLAELTLTEEDYTANKEDSKTGVVQGSFPKPVIIRGPFVVELSEMKESGCDFHIWASRERENCNYWGYYVAGNQETYHDKFAPAIAVKAMFPALYPKEDESLEVIIPAEGAIYKEGSSDPRPRRTIYANMVYKKGAKGFEHNSAALGWCTVYRMSTETDHVTFAFAAEANTTNAAREVDFVFSFRGKSVTYHLYQPAVGWSQVREGLTPGRFGTTCLSQDANGIEGVSLWEIAYMTDDEIVLEESKTLTAGVPYIFLAEKEKFSVRYEGGSTTTASHKNGFYGTFEAINGEELEGKYLLSNNQFVLCGTGCSLDAYRAYMKIDEVPTTPTPAKEGVKRMTMSNPKVKMGLKGGEAERWKGGEAEGRRGMKYIEDGKMYIRVGEEVIQIDGRKVR